MLVVGAEVLLVLVVVKGVEVANSVEHIITGDMGRLPGGEPEVVVG